MPRFITIEQMKDKDIKREIGRIDAIENLRKIIAKMPSCPVCLHACGIHNWALAMGEKPSYNEIKDRHAMAKLPSQMRFDWTGRVKPEGNA